MRQPSRRAGTEADRAFLWALLRDALGPHVEATYGAWDEDWQRAHFEQTTDPAAHEIVELEGERIGCLRLERFADHLALHRILLRPEHQGCGLGAVLVEQVLAAARRAGLPVRLRVFRVSPAVRFYERLGFARVGETDTHFVYERPPGARG